MHLSGRYAPLIVRVAGLPAETMTPFSHPALTGAIAERERLRKELGPLRASLVDCLHQVIRGAAKEERHFLLSVKRCCFNGGELIAHRADPRWPLLANLASSLVGEVVAREEAIATLEAAIEEQYHSEIRKERESIARLSEDRPLKRGVALASPVVARNLGRLNERSVEDYGRREKRLCLTLLRYASRAALKLSPFTTLTRIAIGHAVEDAGGFSFVPGRAWQEKSTVCLHRELLAQFLCLLVRCPQLTENLPVAVNETLSAAGDGSYRFFRPNRWVFDDASKSFRYEDASFVLIKLEGPLVSWLLAELREGPQTVRHLLAGLPTNAGEADLDSLVDSLTELLGAGLLNHVTPWDITAPDLEQQILDHLARLPESDLDTFRNRLSELTRSLRSYAEVSEPALCIDDARRAVEELFQSLAEPAGLHSRIELEISDNTFEEDVLLLPGQDRPGAAEIVHLSWDRMRDLLGDLDPLVRLAYLHSSQHELLHALAALGHRRWPGAAEVEFLELFATTQPLFEEHIRYRRVPASRRPPAFNPLQLRAVVELVEWRQRIDHLITVRFDRAAQALRLCPRALASLLDQAPAIYAGPRDFCAFVQPLSGGTQTWVLNSIGEGFGRFSGRFTAGMSCGARERWASYFTSLSTFSFQGEQVELIDMSCPGGRTIDVHIAQTRRILKLPGHSTTLPAARVLRLQDLRVRLRGADQFPVLIDRGGQRLLPVQLGSSAARGRPTILKFLALFGQGGLPPVFPLGSPRQEDGVEVTDRHRIGSIVYARRRWLIEVQPLLSRVGAQGEARAFADINAWRLAKGIPDRVFARERNTSFRHKPQYIDFSSPSFVQIFRSLLAVGAKSLVLEEALPAAGEFPLDKGHWAAEVQLESFCVRHQFLSSSRRVRGD